MLSLDLKLTFEYSGGLLNGLCNSSASRCLSSKSFLSLVLSLVSLPLYKFSIACVFAALCP